VTQQLSSALSAEFNVTMYWTSPETEDVRFMFFFTLVQQARRVFQNLKGPLGMPPPGPTTEPAPVSTPTTDSSEGK